MPLIFDRCVAVLESHFSAITSLAFSSSGDSMIRSVFIGNW